MVPDILLQEVAGLKEAGYSITIIEEAQMVIIILEDYPLPGLYNKKTTRLLLRIPISYPNGNPDMFWTDVDLRRAKGEIPTKGDTLEDHAGQHWRRFSWHPQDWNPGTGNLFMYLEFVNTGLIKAAQGAS
jgi:hypothetical protein